MDNLQGKFGIANLPSRRSAPYGGTPLGEASLIRIVQITEDPLPPSRRCGTASAVHTAQCWDAPYMPMHLYAAAGLVLDTCVLHVSGAGHFCTARGLRVGT